MTQHVCIIGIDGSGKSTITAALPAILAAETNLTVGAVGETFRVSTPDEDLLAPGFQPEGLPTAARLSTRLKKAAKRAVNHRWLYPILKVSQMVAQDFAAVRLGTRYNADVMVSDGNTLLSTAGRAANYLRAASGSRDDDAIQPGPDAADIHAAFSYIFAGKAMSPGQRGRLPRLGAARLLYRICGRLGIRAAWMPDVVVLLDLSPGLALGRISSRGAKADRHENPADLAQAREMYLRCVEAFRLHRSPNAAHVIPADNLSPGETISAVVEAIRPRLRQDVDVKSATDGGRPLGSSGDGVEKAALDPRYIIRYLVPKWFEGAWREPTFLFSPLGKLFLEEGYSAGVMRAIYEGNEKPHGPLDRVFLGYPLHRAVHDRLGILARGIEADLEHRLTEVLSAGRDLRVFTAPSGFAQDLIRPLQAIARRRPYLIQHVHLIAADLDPKGDLEGELRAWAEKLGVRFTFLRGDITDGAVRESFGEHAPYDMALFVGLSSWLPKPGTLDHLRWLRGAMREDGILFTDCFTPAAYALSGRYAGYRASYYEPDVYRAVLERCGFDGHGARVESGRDGINHVFAISAGATR